MTRPRQRGFTLIETLAAFAIFGLVAALVLPLPPAATSRPRLQAYAMQISGLLQADHSAALLHHKPVASLVDLANRRIVSGSGRRSVELPADVTIDSTLAEACSAAVGKPAIVFFKGGLSCGGTLSLSRPGMAYDIRVNWLTGGTEIVSR